MTPLLYSELAGWYPLVDPASDHAEDCAVYRACIGRAVAGAKTLLELGSGGGHNAVHLKTRFDCTLTDLSEQMLGISRALNPECEHLQGDMRTLRLGRTFDVVLVHDAVMYMTSRADLLAAARTAYAHTRPGGAAIFEPDCTRETFKEGAELGGADAGARSARYAMWSWDPDPADETCRVDFAFLLRDGQTMRAVHDHHVEGLFSRVVWIHTLASAGFGVEPISAHKTGEHAPELFLCRRPLSAT